MQPFHRSVNVRVRCSGVEFSVGSNYLDADPVLKGPQMEVNRSDFIILSPSKVRHVPTGATFTAGAPPCSSYDMIVQVGRAGRNRFPTVDELQHVAWELLQEQTNKAA